MRGGFDAELNTYGQAGKVIGPVVGAFAEMSSDVHVIAKAVAEELALEHCRIYVDKTLKVVKGFFLNQLYRSWGLTAHRGWARLLLDRRCLVLVPNAPGRRSRADKGIKRTKWGVASTPKRATTPAPNPNLDPV